MSAVSNKIQALRQQISHIQPTSFQMWPFSLWPKGIPQGVLCEISSPLGHGKTQAVLQFLRENPHLRCAWLEHTFRLFPPALGLHNPAHFTQILFIETGEDFFWAGLQVVQSQIFPLVVLSPLLSCLTSSSTSRFVEKQLRQFQLLCRRHQCTVILLLDTPLNKGTWPIHLRLQARHIQNTYDPGPNPRLYLREFHAH